MQIAGVFAVQAYANAAMPLQSKQILPKPILPKQRKREPKFYIPSPRLYLTFDQDFSHISFYKKLKSPSAAFKEDVRTHLSVLNSNGTDIKKVSLPGLAHSVLVDGPYAFVVPDRGLPWIYALDTESLEIVAFAEDHTHSAEERFGGHAARVPGQDLIVITTNENKEGKFGRISIRERSTLKEVGNISSYGFEAHDIKVSGDGKRVYVGHYGSLLASGPYAKFGNKDLKSIGQKRVAYGVENLTNIYPACITEIELSSGKLMNRFSSVNGGAHCHFVMGTHDRFYLPHNPSLLINRSDTMTNSWFEEGQHDAEQMKSFLPSMKSGFGTSIGYDEKNKQVLIPARWSEDLNYFSEAEPDNFVKVDLLHSIPKMEKTHGLVMHPDGKSYVITGNNWFTTFERKTHKLIAKRTFPVELFVHAHVSVG